MIAIAAILAVGVLHFVYQLSFISTETSENRGMAEAPAKIEQVRQPPVEAPPVELEAKKTNEVTAPKPAAPVQKLQPQAAPAKTQLKKKEPVETRAERLRRAEKILTGV